MQHGQARAAHPDALCGRGDLHRRAGEHRDGVTVLDTGCGKAARDPPCAFVDLGPGMPDRGIGLAGDHALLARLSVAEHRVGESTHDNPPDVAAGAAWLGLLH